MGIHGNYGSYTTHDEPFHPQHLVDSPPKLRDGPVRQPHLPNDLTRPSNWTQCTESTLYLGPPPRTGEMPSPNASKHMHPPKSMSDHPPYTSPDAVCE